MNQYKARLPGLDGLRGIAAIAVMLFHFDLVIFPSTRLWHILPLSRAYLSVDLFFLMSGFVMAHVYGEQISRDWQLAWKQFAIARIARIYPLFILTLIVVIAIHSTGYLSSRQVSFSNLALAFQPFMLQPIVHGMNWDFPAWSIGTEAAAYAAFIFAARPLLCGKYPVAISIGLLSVLLALCIAKSGAMPFSSQAPAYVRTFAGFGIGVLVFRAMQKHPVVMLEIALASIGPLWIAGYFTHFDVFYFGVLADLFILAVSGRLPALDWKAFRLLGDWSFGIYLWHAAIGFALAAALATQGQSVDLLNQSEGRSLTAIASVLTIAVAAISYRIFEVPARLLIVSRGRAIVSSLRPDHGEWVDAYPLTPVVSTITGEKITGQVMSRRVNGVVQYRAATEDEAVDQDRFRLA